MIDIIIPAYNARKKKKKTLCSIALQVNKDMLNVYIINDGGDDYKHICNKFKDKLNIKELTLDKNKGPGYARNYGISNSNSKYILFMDSDDVLYDSYSVKNLYEKIDNKEQNQNQPNNEKDKKIVDYRYLNNNNDDKKIVDNKYLNNNNDDKK